MEGSVGSKGSTAKGLHVTGTAVIPPRIMKAIRLRYPRQVQSGLDTSGDDTGLSVVWVVALVDVVAGTELLVDYGPAYHSRHKRSSKSKPRK